MRIARLPIVIALTLAGCATTPPVNTAASDALFASAVPFCSVAAHPRDFIGKEIVIRGLLIGTPHDVMLFDYDCPSLELLVRRVGFEHDDPTASRIVERIGRREERTRHAAARIPVVYRATVDAEAWFTPCEGDGCLRYYARNAVLLAAKPETIYRD